MRTFFGAIFLCVLFLAACNDSSEIADTKSDSTPVATTDTANLENLNEGRVKAKFIEFQLGDQPHFIFQDEKGKQWDFRESEVKDLQFGIELPESKATTENQGWSSNGELQGKWFDIKFKFKEQPMYENGPMTKVPVIVEAEQVY